MSQYRQLPNGPKGRLPILGPLSDIQKNFAEFLLHSSRQYGDTFTFKIVSKRVFFFNHPDYIREILQNWELYLKSPIDRDARQSGLGNFLGEGLLTGDGQPWKKQRKLMQPAFHAKYIDNYAESMVDYSEQIVAEWRHKHEVDLEQEMMQLTLNIATKTLFDTEVGDYSELAEALTDVQREGIKYTQLPIDIPTWLPVPINIRRKHLNLAIDEIVFAIIQERELSNNLDRGDLLSMLMLARDENGYSMDKQQLRDEIITLFIAGHETTALTLSWLFYLLSQNEDVTHKLYQEIDEQLGKNRVKLHDLKKLPYLKQVIDETLRLYPAGWLFPRFAGQDMRLGDCDIKAGDMILSSPYVLHRDPRWFYDPLIFDPDRFNEVKRKEIERYTYLPFGGGPRVCIGNSFALMEMQLITATILQNYHLNLIPNQRIEVEPLITIRPKYGVKMRIHPRIDSHNGN